MPVKSPITIAVTFTSSSNTSALIPLPQTPLIPVGDVEQKLNSVYDAGALNAYGLDVGYFITPSLQASVGYYYQHRDQEEVDGSGIIGRLAYAINNNLTLAANLSYDDAFDTRFSADLTCRFDASGSADKGTSKTNNAVEALKSTSSNRNVRVHDTYWWYDPYMY